MSDGGASAVGARQSALKDAAERLRPELHRYCARLMGSVIDGEDVVQDTFAKALVALDGPREDLSLRGWLFRVAHNRALDVLRGRSLRRAEPIEAALEIVDEAALDPVAEMIRQEAISTAVSRFAALPLNQRAVLILKDILDEPLADIAALLNLSVDSVKAHLARGRARLRAINAAAEARPPTRVPSAALLDYVALFNQRNWDGLRALLADDVRLSQSKHPIRAGAADVGMFFSIYASIEGVRLKPALLDGREVAAVFELSDAPEPSYFMWLEWHGGRISFIRDYRYVAYILDGAELELLCAR